MEVLALTRHDCSLLAARFAQHANSQRRMLNALTEAGANDTLARMSVLRQLETTAGVDLGMLCYHFEHRNDATTHPLERAVMNYVAHWRINSLGGEDLWIILERVRQLRGVVEEGRLVGEPEG